ncbi:MAG: IPTL-CTERM sorting domain-containing protein [Planctomycetota bacterium]
MTRSMRTGILVACLGLLPLVADADTPCQHCGPGANWVDSCAEGQDNMPATRALVGIDTSGDCVVDTNLILNGPTLVTRSGPAGGVINTELVSMSLTAMGGQVLTAGFGQGAIPLAHSYGQIVEQGGDPTMADSFFDVFFEVNLGGGQHAYNHSALHIAAAINCVPPAADYIKPTGCTPLYTTPTGGTWVANLVTANHETSPPIPTVSEWGLIGLALLLGAGGVVVWARRRKVAAV